MRRLCYLVILIAAFFAPVKKLNIADLEPVQAVAIYMDGKKVVLETDTEDKGSGTTAEEALEAMKKNTPSVIYLDTAEYLLVAKNAEGYVDAIRTYLKADVKIAEYHGGSVKEEAKYADIHGGNEQLKEGN